jgi:hypothetical protein
MPYVHGTTVSAALPMLLPMLQGPDDTFKMIRQVGELELSGRAAAGAGDDDGGSGDGDSDADRDDNSMHHIDRAVRAGYGMLLAGSVIDTDRAMGYLFDGLNSKRQVVAYVYSLTESTLRLGKGDLAALLEQGDERTKQKVRRRVLKGFDRVVELQKIILRDESIPHARQGCARIIDVGNKRHPAAAAVKARAGGRTESAALDEDDPSGGEGLGGDAPSDDD